MSDTTLELTKALIEMPSVTPLDAGCQTFMTKYLTELGFNVTSLPFEDVSNFWAVYGTEGPIFCFLGHTDVVPPGDTQQWETPPFKATVKGDYLYGRGAADMKGSLAAMLKATHDFVKRYPDFHGRIAFLITSDEEGPAINGTKRVIEYLKKQSIQIDYCLVGEPSSSEELGDTIKVGRRGSLHGKLTWFGQQGHVAYPDLASNPIHTVYEAIHALTQEPWDPGCHLFPATSLQFSNIQSGTGALNVIPGQLQADFNFRFSANTTSEGLQIRTREILDSFNTAYTIQWSTTGEPFLTKEGKLLESVVNSIETVTGKTPILSTAGGTSDGRFIAPTGTEVIELGPVNKTIHAKNEEVNIHDLDKLTKIYEKTLEAILAQ